jgi:hypothetical protein
MYTATIISWVLSVAPTPSNDTATPGTNVAPAVEVDEYTTPAGHRTRWASAKYVLPDGKLAEVFIIADDTASGEATISVDGEAIASATYDPKTGVTRWTSSEPGSLALSATALAAMPGHGEELMDAFAPVDAQGFPCSDFGKKVLRAGKYIWGAIILAGGAACCEVTFGIGCILCHAGGLVLTEEGWQALEDYCA